MSGWDRAALAVTIPLAILGATGTLMIIGAVIGSARISRRRGEDDEFMAIVNAIREDQP